MANAGAAATAAAPLAWLRFELDDASAEAPPPSAVSAATVMPVMTLISGSEASSFTRSGIVGRSIRSGDSSAAAARGSLD